MPRDYSALHFRREEQRRQRWADVSSPVARRVLRVAFKLSPLPDLTRPAFNYTLEQGDPALHEYQQAVQSLLQRSDLAQRMAYGMDMLPDIHAQMPWLVRSLKRLYRPRTIEQLVMHVSQNLDWYLGATTQSELRRVTKRIRWEGIARATFFGLSLGAMLFLWMSFPPELLGWLPLLIVATVLISMIPALLAYGGSLGRLGHTPVLTREGVNATEFYFYLREALADPPESSVVGASLDSPAVWTRPASGADRSAHHDRGQGHLRN